MTERPPLNLYAKMLLVAQDIPRIEKDAFNPNQKYNYASEKAIKEAFHAVFSKHGLLFYMADQGPCEWLTTATDKGMLLVPFEFRIVDAASGEELVIHAKGAGHGRDEKGYYSAVTGAIKYALTSLFLIPTGDDPEADDLPLQPKPQGAPGAAPQAQRPAPHTSQAKPVPQGGTGKLTCISCGDSIDAAGVKAWPAKYSSDNFGVTIGMECFRCRKCEQYVPVDILAARRNLAKRTGTVDGPPVGEPPPDDVPPPTDDDLPF